MEQERVSAAVASNDFAHRHDVQARFTDLDPNHHVNNIALAGMFSEARAGFARSMFAEMGRPSTFHFVVGQVAVRYLAEASWPNIFTIGSGVIDIGTKSIRIGQALFMHGNCCASAEAVLVARQNGQSVPMGEAMLAYLERHRLAPALLPRQLA